MRSDRLGYIAAVCGLIFLCSTHLGCPEADPKVPRVDGMSQSGAEWTINGLGLYVGSVTLEYSSSVSEGCVISQDPAPGTVAYVGASVDLIVSRGHIVPPYQYSSTDGPAGISDYIATASDIYVPESFQVLDVNVTVNVIHSYDADLEVFLESPEGTVIALFADVGGSGNNFDGTVLDDEAMTAIASGTAPFSGSYQPREYLSAFDGEDSQGYWTLTVYDDAGGDSGTLSGWTLTFNSDE